MRLRVPISAAVAAACLVAAFVLPPRCEVNEVGHVRADRVGDLTLGPAPAADQTARFAAACGPPRSPALAGPLRRAPYVQDVTTTTAHVLWTSERLAAPEVAVWPAGAPERAVRHRAAITAHPPRATQYDAALTGLPPGQVACYEVRDGQRPVAGPFGFPVAPPAGAGHLVRLVAFGDMGYRSSDQRAVLEQLGRVPFDLALLAGDIAYPEGTLPQLERNVFEVYAPLMATTPFYPASGNHDYLTADAAPFREVFALPTNGGPAGRERWYSFDRGDLHVVVLDTERLGPDQERWLDADLTASRAPWTIALFHRAPFSSGDHGSDIPTRASLVPILTRHRVPLVISGHEHDYQRFDPIEGVTYLVTGGGGRGTRWVDPTSPGSAFAIQVAHLVYLEVDRDELRLWAIDATGQTFDTARIARPADDAP